MIRVKLKRVVSNNVQRFFSGGNSYYEKFDDGRVVCIDEEIPFEIPRGWEWARIRDISQSYIGLTYSPQNVSSEGTVVLRSSNIQNGQLDLNDIVRVNVEIPSKLYVEENDILICARNGSQKLVGKSAVIKGLNEPMTFGAFMAICKTPLWEYVFCFLQSDLFFVQLRDVSGTTTINQLTQNNFNAFLIPIPPIEEQKRITSKCNTILPFVETYGHQQKHLDSLNNDVKLRLRKSILQEAIQGKLVPQDSTEEPADILLGRISNEKQKLLKEGKLKRKDVVDSVIYKGEDNKYYENVGNKVLDISDEIPFEIPDSWQWVRLGFLFAHNTGKALNRADSDGVLKKYLTTSNVYWNRFDFSEVREMFFADSELDKCTVRKGDLLVCEGGDIGRAAIWPFEYEICIQNHIHRLRAYYSVSTEFYYYVFELYKGIGYIGGKGIGIQGLSSGALHNLVFPLPPTQEQERIVLKIKEMSRFL